MNVDSLKSELQQVLENDVILRKEFNELKRSLSDYRNQLIMRDEDCKRLQVTIDVLNTKLLVMERDNTSYKAELTSFKDLRDSINEQLLDKQNEIDARLGEIQTLRTELSEVSQKYEQQIAGIKQNNDLEKEQLINNFTSQIEELKSNTHYKEAGLREEFENRISELNIHWADNEQSLLFKQEDEVLALREQHQALVEELKMDYANQLSQISSASADEISSLQINHEQTLQSLDLAWTEKLGLLESNFQNEIQNLKLGHESLLNEKNLIHESKVAELISVYEEKLSNILIHSTSQNSKLNEELSKSQIEALESKDLLIELQSTQENREQLIAQLNLELENLKQELVTEAENFASLKADFDIFKQNAVLSDDDKVNELTQEVAQLNAEIANMSLVFENSTNEVAENEKALELLTQELAEAKLKITELESNSSNREEEQEMLKSEILLSIQDEVHNRELEYNKLLAENSHLILEIESSLGKLEAKEAELDFLNNELEQTRLQSLAKSEDFKETLAAKQNEINELTEVNLRLQTELNQLKKENGDLLGQMQFSGEDEETLTLFKQNNELLESENQVLVSEIAGMRQIVADLEQSIVELNEKNNQYSEEIAALKVAGNNQGQDEFIDKLFKQIDLLNDQKLSLLEEKEQMASQLLKMNDVIGSLSQQVDNEKIDVSHLNNHRKNVILANNSTGMAESSPLKEEINNLVREIDKCIALLSA